MKLFRKVKRRERRPDTAGEYLTSSHGVCLYSVALEGFVNYDGLRITPEYWFEPVEIPTDEEIENMAANNYPGIPNPDGDEATQRYNLFQVRRKDGFIQGFKAAIKHLTGGK